MKLFGPALVLALAAVCVFAAPPPQSPDLRDVIHTIRPAYPYQARLHHLEGHGVYGLEVRSDGTVGKVRIVQSTGHKVLDDYARAAYVQWRFRPGHAREVQVPITFTMKGVRR